MALLLPGVLHGTEEDGEGGLMNNGLIRLLAQLSPPPHATQDTSSSREQEELLLLDDQGTGGETSLFPGRFPRWCSYCGTPW